MSKVKKEEIAKIEVSKLNAVLEYLGKRPYIEVANLIQAVQSAQIIQPEVEDEEGPKGKPSDS